MREAEKIIKTDLTKIPKPPYASGGDIFMPEPGNGENAMGVDEETRRLEEAARQGQQRRPEEPSQEARQGPQAAEAGGAGGGREGPPAPPVPSGTPSSEEPSSSGEDDGQPLEGNMPDSDRDRFGQIGDITDSRLRDILDEINDARSQGKPVTRDFLKRESDRIYGLLDRDLTGEARQQAKELISSISRYIEDQSGEAGPRNIGALLSGLEDVDKKTDRFPTDKDKNAEKERLIMETIQALFPTGEGLDPVLLSVVVDYDKPLEYLVNRIISDPLGKETTPYALSFYGGINFSLIREELKTKYEQLRKAGKEEESLRIEGLSRKFEFMNAGADFVHNMNGRVITGDAEQFVGVARAIIIEHLQVLQQTKYAGMVMRRFEDELQRVEARDGKVTTANYMEVTGTIFDEKGKIAGYREGTVEQILNSLNNRPDREKLEEWQLKMAFFAGRDLLNITLRSAEIISRSQNISSESFPQESMARIINPVLLTGQRFLMAEARGGVELINMTKKIFHERREIMGWKENAKDAFVKTIAGLDRKDFEAAGMLDINGVWSGWRQANMISIIDPKTKKRITIQQFVDKNSNKDNAVIDRVRTIDQKGAVVVEGIEDLFLADGELLPEFNHSLGVLLKLNQLLPSEKDVVRGKTALLKAKRKIRTAIWKRVAEYNPLAMANILYKMELKDEENNVPEGKEVTNKELEELSKKMYRLVNESSEVLSDEGSKKAKKDKDGNYYSNDGKVYKIVETDAWKSLRKKLALAHEARMEKIVANLDNPKGEEIPSFEEILDISSLSDKEKEILDGTEQGGIRKGGIRTLGKELAGEFAEIRFPTNPFMNDVPFEAVVYGKAGAEFFRRRLAGDLTAMYGAGQAYTEVLINPGGTPIEKVKETLVKMVDGLGSPQGTEAGQNNTLPTILAYLDFVEIGGQHEGRFKELKKWIQKNSVVSGIYRFTRKPLSLAQKWAGSKALALDENTMVPILDEWLKDGVTRKKQFDEKGKLLQTDTDEYLRKRYKLKLGGILLAFLRDLFPIFAVGALVDFGQKTAKEKA